MGSILSEHAGLSDENGLLGIWRGSMAIFNESVSDIFYGRSGFR